jgi:hypothetical protein
LPGWERIGRVVRVSKAHGVAVGGTRGGGVRGATHVTVGRVDLFSKERLGIGQRRLQLHEGGVLVVVTRGRVLGELTVRHLEEVGVMKIGGEGVGEGKGAGEVGRGRRRQEIH